MTTPKSKSVRAIHELPLHNGGGRVTLAQRIRDAMRALKGAEFTAGDIAEILGAQTFREKKIIAATLCCDMKKRGEVERVAPGKYVYKRQAEKPSHVGTIWSLLRSARGGQTVNHLAALAPDVPRSVIVESLRGWEEMGVLNREERIYYPKTGDGPPVSSRCEVIYRLKFDGGPKAPINRPKADRLKRIREAKKNMLAAIDHYVQELATWNG